MAYAGSAVLEGDAAAFAAAVRSLINNPQFSDVTFVVGRERQEVFAHRCILACRCQAFQGMFSQPQPDAQEPWAPPDPIGPQPCAARGLPGRSRVPVHQQRDPQQLRGPGGAHLGCGVRAGRPEEVQQTEPSSPT
nr:BTB/POZ domain-containing protein 19 isoform X1 [Chrysemys picta bellii]